MTKKYQHLILKVNERNEMTIPKVYREAICKDLGINSLKGCILELNITVIHLKDNKRINFV